MMITALAKTTNMEHLDQIYQILVTQRCSESLVQPGTVLRVACNLTGRMVDELKFDGKSEGGEEVCINGVGDVGIGDGGRVESGPAATANVGPATAAETMKKTVLVMGFMVIRFYTVF